MDKTLVYTPSVIEKLLGRWYKWWYLFIYGIKINTAYFWPDVFWYASRILYVISILYLYTILDSGSNLEEVILTNLFASISAFVLCYDLDEEISTGGITKYLILPTSTNLLYFFRRCGISGRGIIFNLAVFSIILSLYQLEVNFLRLVTVISISSIIGILLKFYSDFIVGSFTFWFKNGYGVINFYLTVFTIFSGSLIPMNSFPEYVAFNPFAFIGYHPMQIYLGKYDINQTILVFLGGIAWCIVLYFLAKLIFKLGLKRNESVGL